MTLRTERLGDLLRRELAELIRREMRDPRVELASVSRVSVSADLGVAEVYVSVLGDEHQRQAAVRALDKARGFLRRALAARTSLRVTPELRFVLDRGAEHSQRISDLLDGLHDGERNDS